MRRSNQLRSATSDCCDSPAPGADERLERLRATLRQSALFERRTRADRMSRDLLTASTACWFGVGLAGRVISRGVPIDVLQMVFALEMVRRTLGLRRSFILIADSNAHGAGFNDFEVLRGRIRLRDTLEATCALFGFPVTILSASEIREAREVEALARRIPVANPYVALQLAQMELMRRMSATIKLGWATPGLDHDERAFDRLYDGVLGHPVAYLYTKGGRTLDPGRPRCSPYVCERRETRVLLEAGEEVAGKVVVGGGPALAPLARAYRRLIGRVARAHRRLVGPDRAGDPLDRIQSVLDRLKL